MVKFRQQALEKLATSNTWDAALKIVPYYYWLILAGVFFAVITLSFWAVFGSIPTRVSGSGILLPHKGAIHDAVAHRNGQVRKIIATIGEHVKKDQVLVELERPDLVQRVNNVNDTIVLLQNEQKRWQERYGKELKLRTSIAQKQTTTLNELIKSQEQHIKYLTRTLSLKKDIMQRGYLAKEDFKNEEMKYHEYLKRLNTNRYELLKVQANLVNLETAYGDELDEVAKEILRSQLELKSLNLELKLAQEIKSPIDGIVATIQTTIGKQVLRGHSIVGVASVVNGNFDDLDAVIFPPANEGTQIMSDMQVLIEPAGVKRAEFGSIVGNVISVSNFPASRNSMLSILYNPELVQKLSAEGDSLVLAVRVRLQQDPVTFSKYKWTSKDGARVKILPGMLCSGLITVKRQPPITLVIPALKKLFGVI